MEVRKKKLSIVANRQILNRTNKNAIQSHKKRTQSNKDAIHSKKETTKLYLKETQLDKEKRHQLRFRSVAFFHNKQMIKKLIENFRLT
jgi:hypothetical protein